MNGRGAAVIKPSVQETGASKTISVVIIDEERYEKNLSFTLQLGQPKTEQLVGGNKTPGLLDECFKNTLHWQVGAAAALGGHRNSGMTGHVERSGQSGKTHS
ncbi:hypothetical protein BIW11_04492 [Tropilaelaps mercedesae]|uniref:Uncharacterized protein n=1 Tax=Tropilaelaps mercedesae TaxID=418985 RepID=A0A1V9X606_9ACAR|nr:hypothetical protein BIW11_04492 [Tropilaelaps mercedesae]